MSHEELLKTENGMDADNTEDTKYYALIDYSQQMERVCNRVINIGKIVFVGFPIALMIVQNLADLDKTSVLLVWIVGMFLLAIILIMVGYFDHTLKERLVDVYGDEHNHSPKLSMLQGRAMVKTIISEVNKDRDERSLEDFSSEFTKNAIEDEDSTLDKIIQDLIAENNESGKEIAVDELQNTEIESETIIEESITHNVNVQTDDSTLEINEILREFNEE